MKKIIFLTSALALTGYIVQAQESLAAVHSNEQMLTKQETSLRREKREDRKEVRELRNDEVNYYSKEQFFRDFGNVQVLSWKRENNFDVATFRSDNGLKSAYYDAHSELVGTTQHKTFADLPAEARKYINREYSSYAAGPAIFFDDNEANATDMALYGQSFDDADNYFIELYNGKKRIVLQADPAGNVSFFKQLY